MIDYILVLPILVSFLITLFFLPIWIKKAKQIGLLWDDMNKLSSEKVVGSGGIGVVLGTVIGILIYIAYRTFYIQTTSFLIEVFASLVVILFLAGVGLIDDLLGWQRGGISIRSRLILTALAAIPLIVINAGKSTISIPFLGAIDLGIIYPLILVPIGIVGATTTYNFLAGFNGLEAGQGVLILSAISIVALFTGNSWLSIISLCMVASLFAFLFYNFYPAKIFPGDVLTYTVGGMIAIIAILGSFEKIAIFFFIPYIIETGLKLRGGLKKQSFGKPKKDGSLDLKYNKIYGLEHLAIASLKKMNIESTEKNAVYLIWLFQLLIIVAGFIIFREGIFL